MTDDPLVQQIVAEVMKQLQARPDTAETPPPPPSPAGPRILMLFTGGDRVLSQVMDQVMDLSRAKADLRIVCTESARSILGQARLEALAAAGELLTNPTPDEIYAAVYWAEAVAVPVLTQNTLAKAALGIRDSLATNLLAGAILMERRLMVCTESAVPEQAPAPYRAMLQEYVNRLRLFGIQTVPVGSLASACLSPSAPQPVAAPVAQPGNSPGRLITAAAVEAAAQTAQKELVVSRGAIVTPLARDLCRERGISLVVR